MMTDKFHEFASRYDIRNIRISRDCRSFDYYHNRSVDYYSDREETVEMEIPRRSFEHLVDTDREFNKIYQDQREEAYMRREHPAIKDAYDKYKMLLELYR